MYETLRVQAESMNSVHLSTAGTMSRYVMAAITLPPAGHFDTDSFLSGQGTKWIRAAAHSVDIEL